MTEIDLLDSLEALGYSGPLIAEEKLQQALKLGPKSIEFTVLTAWLASELQTLYQLEDVIHSINDTDESSSFLMEVSSFLKELYCPHDSLLEGSISQRLGTEESRILFLNFLCSELRAARILHVKTSTKKNPLDIELAESDVSTALSYLIKILEVDLDHSETSSELLEKIRMQIEEMSLKSLKEPVFQVEMSSEQWDSLQRLQEDMHSEYKMRREMLLNRLDVTILSFKWGENSKGKDNKIAAIFQPLRLKLKTEPSVHISDILAAREDITIVQKTSSAALLKNTNSAVHKYMMDRVPDRGGRPNEQRPMPEFWKRTDGGRGGFGGERGQFRGHGKRNWNKGDRNRNR